MRKPTQLVFLVACLSSLLCLSAPRLAAGSSADAPPDTQPAAEALAQGLAALRQHARDIHKPGVWTLIDFDLPFTSPRLWILDARHDNAALAQSRVSHAWSSGMLYATQFSNVPDSNLSSLGSFVTAEHTYEGKFGHSLKVRGLERGINDLALRRGIIFHPDMNLTHSLGCFMLPMTQARSLIDRIVGGTFVYVHRSAQ